MMKINFVTLRDVNFRKSVLLYEWNLEHEA